MAAHPRLSSLPLGMAPVWHHHDIGMATWERLSTARSGHSSQQTDTASGLCGGVGWRWNVLSLISALTKTIIFEPNMEQGMQTSFSEPQVCSFRNDRCRHSGLITGTRSGKLSRGTGNNKPLPTCRCAGPMGDSIGSEQLRALRTIPAEFFSN